MNLNKLKIGTRLAIGFSIVLLLALMLAALGVSRMAAIQAQLDAIVTGNNAKQTALNTLVDSCRNISIGVRDLILMTDEKSMVEVEKQILHNKEAYARNALILDNIVRDEIGTAMLARIKAEYIAAMPVLEGAAVLGRTNRTEEAIAVMLTQSRPASDKWLRAIDDMIAYQDAQSHEIAQEARATFDSARTLMIATSLFALLLGVGSSWFVTRSITTPLGAALALAKTVATGDLTSTIDVHGSDETSQLLHALLNMNANLVNIVGKVRAGTDQICTVSAEIAQGNIHLSERTESQASSLEETASSMEQLASTIKQNAENARQANELAETASSVATQGGDAVAEVVQTMQAIHTASLKIVDIISVIDSIAFQTNILALNAAVEAARAGEQGRGFAVVASEVRSLAHRSSAAAKEIKDLINRSVQTVEKGNHLVNRAGNTMTEVVDSIRRVAHIMADISTATIEQTAGIDQVNQAVIAIDDVTQQNAALVEQASAAAQAMRDQAEELTRLVAIFKLDAAHASTISFSLATTKAPNSPSKHD